jgi:hypothetical protein
MARRIVKENLHDGKFVVGRDTLFIIGDNPIKMALALERVQSSDRPSTFIEDKSAIEKYTKETLNNYKVYKNENTNIIVGIHERIKNHQGILNYLESVLIV